MSVDVSTTQSPVAVSVNDTTVSVVVSGGIGPQGPSGAASPATTSTLGGIIVGSNLTVTADGTLSATGGGAVSSVAGRTGAVVLASGDVSGLASVATSGLASDLAGTLADARLTANVALAANQRSAANQSESAVDCLMRNFPTATLNLANNQVFWTFFTPLKTVTVSQISVQTSSVAGVGVTACRMGLYTFDETTATLVARTAVDTTIVTTASVTATRIFNTAGDYPATYTLQAGQRYGVAIQSSFSSTPPTVIGYSMNNTIAALAPRVNGVRISQSDLPTSNNNFATTSVNVIWFRVS